MSDGLLNFVVSLEDRVSPSAKAAASALSKLETELRTSKTALATYQQQLSRANEMGDVEGHRKYSALVAQARAETYKLQEALSAMGPKAEEASGAIGELSAVLGPLGTVAEIGIAAVVGVTVALAALAVEGVKTALEVGEVNRRLSATFEALGDKSGEGAKTLSWLNKLATELPQSRGELAKWAQQYQAFGITDLGALRGQIQATAAAQAIAGTEGAASYQKLAEKIQDAVQGGHKLKMGRDVLKDIALSGANASDVATRLGLSLKAMDSQLKAGSLNAAKFGKALEDSLQERGKGPLAAMGDELGTLATKLKETWNHLFDGIDTSPITDAIKSIIELGDQGTTSGQVLHSGISGAIQGIIDWMGKALVEGEILFVTLETYAVEHQTQLALVSDGFKLVGDSIILAAQALESLVSIDAPGWLLKLLGGIASSSGGLGGAVAGAGLEAASGHAAGGVVGKPAAGEYFASVAPGEMILPKDDARQIAGSGLGPVSSSITNTSASNTNGGVQIGHLELHITAPDGVTDATSISATGLAMALERYQLASGR
jgi:hypothetical protein